MRIETQIAFIIIYLTGLLTGFGMSYLIWGLK